MNMMIWFTSYLDALSCVSIVNNNGHKYTALRRSSAQRDGIRSIISDTDRMRSIPQKVLDLETCGSVLAE